MPKLLLTIFLNLLILVLLAVFVFMGIKVYSAVKSDDASLSDFINPKYLLSLINIDWDERTVLYDSQTFTFEHPESWEPRKRDIFGDGGETIDLKIPIFYQVSKFGGNGFIGYSKLTIQNQRPDPASIISEQEIIIANRKGTKWVFRQNNLVLFRYAIPLQNYSSGTRQMSSFYIQAESNNQNKNLEKVLNNLVKSVIFKSDNP